MATSEQRSAATEVVVTALARRAAASRAARRVRVLAGTSQAELGAACGVDSASVYHWEARKRRARGPLAVAYVETLVELARGLRDDGVDDEAVAEFIAWGERLDARRAVPQ